jgi:hypothetical protein
MGAAIGKPDRAFPAPSVVLMNPGLLLICLQQSCMIALLCPPEARDHGGTTGQNRNGMGGSTSYGLGRRDTAAPGGLLSAASRSSPAGRGRGDDPGREGTAAR